MRHQASLRPNSEVLAQRVDAADHTVGQQRFGLFPDKHQGEDWHLLCQEETPEWIRLIIDARRANWAHRPPPCTRLATPRALLDLQFKRASAGAPCAFGVEADVADCFYNFVCEATASWFGIDMPLPYNEWVRLGWGGGPIYSDITGSGCP